MADFLKVDPGALTGAAGSLDALLQRVRSSPLGGDAASRLLSLEGQLPETHTGASAQELGRALAQISGQIEATLQGFGTGLRVAAEAYHRVDVVSSQAAGELMGESPAGQIP